MATTISGSSNSSFGGTIDSTGIDDNATSTAVTLDSSGNVGIGTSIPGAKLQVVGSSNTDVALLGTAGTRLTINTDDSIGEVKLKVEDPSGNNYAKFMTFHTEGGSGTTERLRILSSGGITFNGDTAAANALDDYEEGTFLPVYGATTAAPNYTYTAQSANYIKIGKMVFVRFYIAVGSVTTQGSGILKIDNLPFVAQNDPHNGWGGSVGWNGTLANWSSNPYNFAVIKNTNDAFVHNLNMSTGAIGDMQASAVNAGCTLEGSLSYETT